MKTGQILATKVDVTQVEQALAETSKSLKAIQRSTLRIVAAATSKCVRAALMSSDLDLQSGTGELKRAYTYKVKKDASEANVYPRALKARDETIFPKAMTLSYGHEGPTERARYWRIAPRGFVQSGQKYAESGGYMSEVQKMIDKELEKYWS